MNFKIFITLTNLAIISLILSCSYDPTSEVEYNHDVSKNFIASEKYDLNKWLELDSLFDSSVYNFKSNQPNLKSEDIDKVDSLILSYDELSKQFYKNYFLSQLEELKSIVGSINFDNKLSLEKLNNFLSNTVEEFYNYNQKLSPETRKNVSENLGVLYAEIIQNSAEVFNEDLMSNIEDFSNQFKSTLQNLFKQK